MFRGQEVKTFGSSARKEKRGDIPYAATASGACDWAGYGRDDDPFDQDLEVGERDGADVFLVLSLVNLGQ